MPLIIFVGLASPVRQNLMIKEVPQMNSFFLSYVCNKILLKGSETLLQVLVYCIFNFSF